MSAPPAPDDFEDAVTELERGLIAAIRGLVAWIRQLKRELPDVVPEPESPVEPSTEPVHHTVAEEDLVPESGSSSENAKPKGRGFASISRERRREIASLGGKASHAKGTGHEFSSQEAMKAGHLGGTKISKNREHMSALGKRGGTRRAALFRRSRPPAS